MKKTILLTFCLVLAHPLAHADTGFLQGLGDTRYHHIESELIGRGFHVFVMVPDEYDPSSRKTYPTVYLLDGGALFPLMSAYSRYLTFGEEMPDSIIVGIAYGSDNFEGGNYRSTDYTAPSNERDWWGGAENFQTFLADDLIPLIEENYASDTQRRVIFGQSIGGQFVLYTAQTKPDLFWGHIASNPALHRNLEFYLDTVPAEASADSRLFVASATGDDRRFRAPAQAWISHWTAEDDLPWDLRTVDLEGHNHMSAPPASFREGMRWLFYDR